MHAPYFLPHILRYGSNREADADADEDEDDDEDVDTDADGPGRGCIPNRLYVLNIILV